MNAYIVLLSVEENIFLAGECSVEYEIGNM